jgi:antitoxin VapB
MPKTIARIFRNGRNQAVRIPIELSFETDAVTIERQGESLILRPVETAGWDRFFSDPTLVLPPEFEVDDDLPPQERPPL